MDRATEERDGRREGMERREIDHSTLKAPGVERRGVRAGAALLRLGVFALEILEREGEARTKERKYLCFFIQITSFIFTFTV